MVYYVTCIFVQSEQQCVKAVSLVCFVLCVTHFLHFLVQLTRLCEHIAFFIVFPIVLNVQSKS